jgi:hypothetical protein
VRVLVANTPRMYREFLALSIQRERPNFEVLIAAPKELNGEVERLAPHALVRDDDGVETSSPNGVICWAGIIIDNHLNARISVDGRISEIHDVSLEEFLAALDEAQGLISANDGRETPPEEELTRSP